MKNTFQIILNISIMVILEITDQIIILKIKVKNLNET